MGVGSRSEQGRELTMGRTTGLAVRVVTRRAGLGRAAGTVRRRHWHLRGEQGRVRGSSTRSGRVGDGKGSSSTTGKGPAGQWLGHS